VDNIFKVIDMSSKVEKMQEKLGDYYSKNPTLEPLRKEIDEAWSKLCNKTIVKFILKVYEMASAQYEKISDELEWYEKLGIPADSGTIGMKKNAKEIADKYGADWLFDPAGTLADKGEEYFKEKLNDFLKKIYQGNYPSELTSILRIGAERIYSGKTTWGDYKHPRELAREIYANYMDKHSKLNIANLNRELYRLNLKLGVDTVVKGFVIYQSVKDLKDPSEFQEAVKDSIDKVDKAFAAFDSVYQSYKGAVWLEDCGKCRGAMAETVEIITRTK
jgi:hypothetical protein